MSFKSGVKGRGSDRAKTVNVITTVRYCRFFFILFFLLVFILYLYLYCIMFCLSGEINNYIHVLGNVRQLATDDTARTVACCIVGSRLDYCNAVLYGALTTIISMLHSMIPSLPRERSPVTVHATVSCTR